MSKIIIFNSYLTINKQEIYVNKQVSKYLKGFGVLSSCYLKKLMLHPCQKYAFQII